MLTVHFVLMFLALVCLVLAALEIHAPKLNLLALGLALWACSVLIQ